MRLTQGDKHPSLLHRVTTLVNGATGTNIKLVTNRIFTHLATLYQLEALAPNLPTLPFFLTIGSEDYCLGSHPF
jgi:hypothetical protein